MKVYILGKLGKLTHEEWKLRHQATIEAELEGKRPLNYAEESQLHFEDTALQLVNEISLLLQADCVWLVSDWNQSYPSQLLLMIAIEMQLPIQPGAGCIIPHRLSFDVKL
jgi:hypothetical protein